MAKNIYEELYWKNGGRWDIWVREVSRVKSFIKENNLKPLRDAPFLLQGEAAAAKAGSFPIYPWPNGGMKIAHLHFGRDIYVLNERQWKDFSTQIMDSYKEKLSKVNVVNFDQLMEFSDAVENFM